jgi:hypothetical protein
MGLGKTVMTIALILSDPRGEHSNYIGRDERPVTGRDTRTRTLTPSIRGGTLILCPMALLGQWKVSSCLCGQFRKITKIFWVIIMLLMFSILHH